MTFTSPGEVEVYAFFSKHLGPRYMGAGVRLQFVYNGEPGVHFRTKVSSEYREPILRGVRDGMSVRFPNFPETASILITEVVEHPVDSCQVAFYLAARSVIEQAYLVSESTVEATKALANPK